MCSGETVFATHKRDIAHMNSMAVTVFMRPAQSQISQKPSMDWGGAHKVPPLAEERLAIGGCWEWDWGRGQAFQGNSPGGIPFRG